MHNRKCFASHMGIWAIEPLWMRGALRSAQMGTLNARAAMDAPTTADMENIAKRDDEYRMAAGASKVIRDGYNLLYEVRDGVATIAIDGPMAKFDSKYGGTNTVRTRKALRQAASDGDAGAILLLVDSPGGNSAGTMELAADVRAAGESKILHAFGDDMLASAAYWVASQAQKVFANEMAMIGSIGTYAVLYDQSKAAEMEGVKVHVISTGELKGSGEPGTEVTPAKLEYVQVLVNDINAQFLKGVSAGRGDRVNLKEVTDGRVWIAAKAKKLGLIDAISTMDAVHAELAEKVARKARARGAEARLRLAELE